MENLIFHLRKSYNLQDATHQRAENRNSCSLWTALQNVGNRIGRKNFVLEICIKTWTMVKLVDFGSKSNEILYFLQNVTKYQGNAIEMLRKSEYLGFRRIFVIFIEPEAHFSPMCLQSALTSTVLTFVRKLKLLSKEQCLYFS